MRSRELIRQFDQGGLGDKITRSKNLIDEHAGKAAEMISFGKDSMALLHLVRETLGRNLPVIYHRYPWFPAKNEFADSVINSWNLVVHDYPPGACGVKYDDKHLELVARYPFGLSAIDLPINTVKPVPRRDFICGLNDWILRPKTTAMVMPWKTVFIGHKSSDVDPVEKNVPLKSETTEVGEIKVVFPLKDWTDDDVWDYIEENHVPYDKRRYANRKELKDKWLNPDYIHACTKCIDPRDKSAFIMCPKLDAKVPNFGSRVLRLQVRPDYIEEAQYATS